MGRIFRHSQVVEDDSFVEGEFSHDFGDGLPMFPESLQDADGEASESGDVFGADSFSDARAILIVVPVKEIMHALDSPVTAVEGEQTLRRGFLGRTAGDAECDFPGFLSGFFVESLAFDQKDLSDLREVEVVIERRTTPDSPGFDASVIRRRDLDEIGCFPVLEGERDIALQRWLIAFDREVIMRSGRDYCLVKPLQNSSPFPRKRVFRSLFYMDSCSLRSFVTLLDSRPRLKYSRTGSSRE